MTIVPDGTELIIEALLLNKDVGFVELGQEVIIKIETYPFQKYGTIKGSVYSISPNAYFNEKLGYVYKVKVKMEQPYVELEEKKYEILAGMQVKVEIKTGQRRILDFFLEPIVKYLDESLKLR